MIIGFTGHRPEKIGFYKIPNPIYNYVKEELIKHLLEIKPDKCISGMALGFDQLAAQACIELEIPFIAAVPFKGQELIWPAETQKEYQKFIEQASEVVIVSPGGYSAPKMQIRNQWIVDNCNKMICCWDGSKGGTANCLSYAEKQQKEIIRIDPKNVQTH